MRLILLPKGTVIAHGKAKKGVDAIVDRLAHKLGYQVEPYPVEAVDGPWPAAGIFRNHRMVDDFRPTRGIAFRAFGKSNGTDDCARYMRSKGVRVEVIHELGPSR